MRLGVVFSLFFAFGFAQEKHLTSDFHLSKDVTKYESVEYKYNAAIKNFEVSETSIDSLLFAQLKSQQIKAS